MEPVGMTAAAIATLIVTKAFEKTGEKLGERVVEQAGKLLGLLQKFPRAIAAITQAEQKPVDAGVAQLDPVVAEELTATAKEDAEVAKAIAELAEAAKADSNPKLVEAIQFLASTDKSGAPTVQNFTKLAEGIKAVFQGNVIQNQTLNF